MADWLNTLKSDMGKITAKAALDYWKSPINSHVPYFNYRFEHVKIVEKDAVYLQSAVGGDLDIILASVWLHDRCKPQFNANNHGAKASEWAKDNLAKIGFPKNKIEEVCYAVSKHEEPANSIPEEKIEARILWDADKVSHFGAAEMVNWIFRNTSGCFGGSLKNDDITPTITLENYAETLLKIKPTDKLLAADWFYFEQTRELGKKRIKAQLDFLQAFEEQIHDDNIVNASNTRPDEL